MFDCEYGVAQPVRLNAIARMIECFILIMPCGYVGPERRQKERQSSGDRKGVKATGENYSTVKSAQRFSATLSIRRSGRVQIIDM
jgi:hypothetical protein